MGDKEKKESLDETTAGDEASESEEIDRLELINDNGMIGRMDSIQMDALNLSVEHVAVPTLNDRTRGSVHRPIVTESKIDQHDENDFVENVDFGIVEDETVPIQRMYTLHYILPLLLGIIL